MTTQRDIVTELRTEIDGARINKQTKERMTRKLALLNNDAPIGADEETRPLNAVYPHVRAVHVFEDEQRHGWYERVEVKFDTHNDDEMHVGDLTRDQAIAFATALLQAASKLR